MANKKTSDYAALPGGVPNDAWLFDIANATVLNYKGTSLEVKDYVNAGKAGGKNIDGGTLTTETLTLRNNPVDDLGFDIEANGILHSNTANYETLVTDNNDIPNKKYVDDTLAVGFAKHDNLTVSSPGQTSFTLSTTPDDVTTALLTVNGQTRKYGAGEDFTISGTTLTWLDPGGVTLKTTDVVQIWYDISLTPPSLNPLFVAWNNAIQTNATGDGTAVDLAFSQTDANVGNHYNTGTGIFTAPDDGIYEFQINLLVDNVGAAHSTISIKLIRAGGTPATWLMLSEEASNIRDASNSIAVCCGMKIKLDTNDTAKFQIEVSGSTKTVNILPGGTYSGELTQEI
jgi:hypothetical protein